MNNVEQLTVQWGEDDVLKVSLVTNAVKIERRGSHVFIPLNLTPIVAKILRDMSKEEEK